MLDRNKKKFCLNKVSLSCFHDKRYIHDNGITSYACGHKLRVKIEIKLSINKLCNKLETCDWLKKSYDNLMT